MSTNHAKKHPQPIDAMEYVFRLIRETIKAHVDPTLLKKREHGASKNPYVKWRFGLTNTDQDNDRYELILDIRHGPFGEYVKSQTRGWWRLEDVTCEEIISALFHAVSWEHSPYWWDGKGWKKRMEVT